MLISAMLLGHDARFIPLSSASLQPLAADNKTQKSINPLFSVACALFPPLFTKEGKLTPLFSSACARFCRYVGVGECGVQRSLELFRFCFSRQDCENLIIPPLNPEAAESAQ